MKKRMFCLIIVALLALGLNSQGFCMANRPRASKKSTSKQTESIQRISGKISGYSWSNSTITVTPTGAASITVEIDKGTKISKSGKWIKMTDIKTGNMATVDYVIKDGEKIARIIIVQEKVAISGKNKR